MLVAHGPNERRNLFADVRLLGLGEGHAFARLFQELRAELGPCLPEFTMPLDLGLGGLIKLDAGHFRECVNVVKQDLEHVLIFVWEPLDKPPAVPANDRAAVVRGGINTELIQLGFEQLSIFALCQLGYMGFGQDEENEKG